MSAEGQFPIKITGDASSLVAASQQTNVALESNKIKLAELTPEQQAQVQALTAGKAASQDAARAALEHGEKLQFLGLKTGEIKKLTGELAAEFPLAGLAARLMINPIVSGITLAIMVFGAAKKALDDWDKRLEESAQRNASKDFLPGIEAKKAALDAAKASAAEFAVALDNIGKAEDKFKTAVSQAIDKLHEFMNAQAEVNSAGEAKDLAEVDLEQKQGKLTEVQAIQERAAIRKRYREEREKTKTQGENDEVKLLEAELQHDKESQAGLKTAADDARARAKRLGARRDQLVKDKGKGEEKLGEYDKEAAQADAELTEAQRQYDEEQAVLARGGGRGFGPTGLSEERLRKAQTAYAEAADRQRRQREFNRRAEREIERLSTGQIPEAEGAAGVAETRARSNADRINELERTLPERRDVNAIRQRGRGLAGGLQEQTASIEVNSQMRELLERARAQVQQDNKAIIEAMHSSVGFSQDALKKMEEHRNTFNDLDRRVRALEGRPNRN